jgi:hypothetical protein
LESLSAAHADEGIGEYLLMEACRLSRSRGGTCMLEVLHVRCTGGGAEEGACTNEGCREGANEGSREGGTIGVRGITRGTMIEVTSLRNL